MWPQNWTGLPEFVRVRMCECFTDHEEADNQIKEVLSAVESWVLEVEGTPTVRCDAEWAMRTWGPQGDDIQRNRWNCPHQRACGQRDGQGISEEPTSISQVKDSASVIHFSRRLCQRQVPSQETLSLSPNYSCLVPLPAFYSGLGKHELRKQESDYPGL